MDNVRDGQCFCNPFLIFSCHSRRTFIQSGLVNILPVLLNKESVMTMKAGILSDTHISEPASDFNELVSRCFGNCDVIIHAGELTSIKVLEAFSDFEVHAVHGNMCGASSFCSLPREKTIRLHHYPANEAFRHFL